MKPFILTLLALSLLCLPTMGEKRVVTENDSLGRPARIIELNDTMRDGVAVTDTLSITTYTGEQDTAPDLMSNRQGSWSDWRWFEGPIFTEQVVIIAIIFLCPVLIVFVVLAFAFKSRREKYRLAQQAIASGQPLPDNFFKKIEQKTLYDKGVRNICIGLGLFIFLWALTEEFGLGCIGLLVMLNGVGQVIISYRKNKQDDKPTSDTDNGQQA